MLKISVLFKIILIVAGLPVLIGILITIFGAEMISPLILFVGVMVIFAVYFIVEYIYNFWVTWPFEE